MKRRVPHLDNKGLCIQHSLSLVVSLRHADIVETVLLQSTLKITAMTFIGILLRLAITFNDISFVIFIIYFRASCDTSL